MEEEADYYSVLNLTRLATEKEIRKAYLDLARVFHPDRAPGRNAEELENIFHVIEEAYKILSDPLLRPIYDKYGKLGLRGMERFTFMKKYVDKFYTEQDEEKQKEILSQILSYLNQAMIQELNHERQQIYKSNSSIHIGISMKDFCNHAQKYVDHSSLSKAMRLISLLQAGVESKVTFVAIENWKFSIKSSNVVENQHSIGAGQLGLRAAYKASNNVKLITGLSFHSISEPSVNLGTKLSFDNYFLKPEITFSQNDFDYRVSFGGKMFNQFDFKQGYGPTSSQSEVQFNLGSKGILKTSVSKDFSSNSITVTPTWHIHLADDIINQLDLQLSSNGRLTLAHTLSYIFSAGKRLGLQTQVNLKKNELKSITFSFLLSLENFSLKIPITLGDEVEFSSLLLSTGVALIGHFIGYCFHSISGRLIHNEKNYVRFLKFLSEVQTFHHFESELNIQQARGRVSIFKAYFGEIEGIRNLYRKKKRNFKTPTDCDEYLKYSVYEVTLYLQSKVRLSSKQIKDGRRWTLTNEILRDKMLFDPTWRDNKRRCGFYIVVQRREEIEDMLWNPDKQHLLLII